MSGRGRSPNWQAWLDAWDRQQEGFNPQRERRFDAMFDLLEASVGRRFAALDLGAGPGSLSVRLLRRFPRATSVAVDYDPVTRRIGREALGTVGGRLTWWDAKLGTPDWTEALPRRRFDAAVSTTALHWLRGSGVRQLYRDLAGLVRSGGIFLNGDRLAPQRPSSTWERLDRNVGAVRRRGRSRADLWKGWSEWWRRAAREPALRAEYRERERRAAQHPTGPSPSLETHRAALRRAGFRDVEVVWQDLDDRILYARRP